MPGIIVNSNAGLGTYDGINQNKYVATLDGPWMDAIFGAAFPKTKIAGSPVPAGPGGSVSVVGGEDIVLTKSSRNKKAAVEFLRYMLGYGSQAQMALAGQMPVLKSSSRWLTKVKPYYETYVQQLATAKPRTPTPKWTQIDQVFVTQIAKAFQGARVGAAGADRGGSSD